MTGLCICYFIICSSEEGLLGADCPWKKYSTFLNLFYSEVKQYIERLEPIKNRTGRHEVSVVFNQTYLKDKNATQTHTHTHTTYIYIYVCVCVCVCVCD